jgi:hypothetical protein
LLVLTDLERYCRGEESPSPSGVCYPFRYGGEGARILAAPYTVP